MKRLFLSIAVLMQICANSCSNGSSEAPSEESVVSLARTAAHAICITDHSDTLAVQRAIVDAHAMRSDLILNGHQKYADIFEKTLKEELSKRDPQVAQEMFK